MRERLRLREGQSAHQIERRRRTRIRYLAEGVGLFVIFDLLFMGAHPVHLLFMAIPGLAVGWVCHRLHAGRGRYTAVAVAAYFMTYGLFGWFSPGPCVVFVCLAMGIGYSHEMMRADGSEG